ncbi:MAG: transcriptional regulator [Rhizonema sp. NSF051]|nr:transcriptional regulator [Rhizonema sp. NSF051]
MPTTTSYHNYLVSSLKDSRHAANYIAVALELEDQGREPELLRAMLKNVMEARILSNNVSIAAKQYYEKLDGILSETGGAEIYTLIEFLDALGYRIEIALKN